MPTLHRAVVTSGVREATRRHGGGGLENGAHVIKHWAGEQSETPVRNNPGLQRQGRRLPAGSGLDAKHWDVVLVAGVSSTRDRFPRTVVVGVRNRNGEHTHAHGGTRQEEDTGRGDAAAGVLSQVGGSKRAGGSNPPVGAASGG